MDGAAPDVVQEAQKNILSKEQPPSRSVSLENVSLAESCISSRPDVSMEANKKSHFPHSFIRSRRPCAGADSSEILATQSSKSSASCDDLSSNSSGTLETSSSSSSHRHIRYRSVISVSQPGNNGDEDFKLVRRKRSFSLVALPVSTMEAEIADQQPPQMSPSSRSEESGYESDSTLARNGGSDSPQRSDPSSSIQVSFVSSLKSDLVCRNKTDEEKLSLDSTTEHVSITGKQSGQQHHHHCCCNCRCNRRQLPVISETAIASRYARSSSLDRKKWLTPQTLMEIDGQPSPDSSLMSLKTASLPPGMLNPALLPARPTSAASSLMMATSSNSSSATPRQFKMLRLVKGETGELGIYIKKKPSPDSGSLGYVIAGIEPGALAHR